MELQVAGRRTQPSKRVRAFAPLSSRVERRWWAYAMAAGAGVLGATPQAHAGIVYTKTDIYFTSGSVYIDLNNDGVNDLEFMAGVERTIYNGAAGGLSAIGVGKVNGVAVGAAGALALSSGAVIGHHSKFQQFGEMAFFCETYYGCDKAAGKWKHAKDKYLGLVFDINGQAHYGWAELTVNLSPRQGEIQTTLLGYAFNTVAGQSIMAGQTSGNAQVPSVPEPATLGLLALGSAALGLWRRKKGVANEAQN